MNRGVVVPGVDEVDRLTAQAAAAAVALLTGVGTRLAHSSQAATQAGLARDLLDEPWRSALVAAAWLHDVGYSPALVATGFHPLDGARFLREERWPDEVCCLVAWHTSAACEAVFRGLDGLLVAEYARPPERAMAVLAWADLTSSPTGMRCSVEHRVADIFRRYPVGSVVHRAMVASFPHIWDLTGQIETLLVAGRVA